MELINNGMHSIKRALSALFNLNDIHLKDEIEYEMKDIIINFHHSLETLFKYLIENKSEYLVYEKLKDYFEGVVKQKLNKSNGETSVNRHSNTVDFIDAINRVIVLYE